MNQKRIGHGNRKGNGEWGIGSEDKKARLVPTPHSPLPIYFLSPARNFCGTIYTLNVSTLM